MKTFINENCEAFFSNRGYSYESLCNLMKDCATNSVREGISKKVADEELRSIMLEFFGLDEEKVKSPKLVNRAIRKHKEGFFEIIEDVVDDLLVQGWENDPFFMQWVETKNIADGDANEFYSERETLLSVHEVAGDHHYISVQRLGNGETFSVKQKRYGIAIGTDLRLYLMGRVDFSKMINAMYSAFDRKIKTDIYAELSGIGTKLPVSSTFNKAMKITAANKLQIDELIEMVSAANDGSDVVLVGTSSAVKQLSNLTDVDWISSDAKNELYHTGRLGSYEGTSIVEIPQRLFREADGSLSKLINSNQILVLPAGMDKFIKFVNFGDTMVYEIREQGAHLDDTMVIQQERSFGVSVVVGKYFGNITITEQWLERS